MILFITLKSSNLIPAGENDEYLSPFRGRLSLDWFT